ncbi:SPOR domain-containing protein [Microbacterium bovistercoris]|uniref:SPOR domain-containing protein n=1 Tax=Microbacterium bovistercoris TaxID=2293570 RepID=A0A371NUJ1_9MICO|nr:SPOR domain-containing protein [Microbacterium bovistercoris]REJ05577.1 SPOR domain-containing protein [Microbacterium bovistercoris]
MPEGDDKYWYNLTTKQVEYGMISASYDRVGPFDTAAEAARAPEVMVERSNKWAEEEAAENGWD